MMKTPIYTSEAPPAIGTYSQAVRAGQLVFLSGQIPLTASGELLQTHDIKLQIRQIFLNLEAVAKAAGGNLDQVVKLTVYLTSLENFSAVNDVMLEFFSDPFPARAAVEVAGLPKGVPVEIDAILSLD
ncbi:MAG: Rid family detoxifying hydrolase [Gammaproteobacteria bacterium]|nr:Rid family detoxifying hydrolase [Gammaproteobacteria bacterium]